MRRPMLLSVQVPPLFTFTSWTFGKEPTHPRVYSDSIRVGIIYGVARLVIARILGRCRAGVDEPNWFVENLPEGSVVASVGEDSGCGLSQLRLPSRYFSRRK